MTSCLYDLSSAVRFAAVMCAAVILATPLGRRVGFCLQFTLSVLPRLKLIDFINCWPFGNREYFPIQKRSFGGWKMLLLPYSYFLLVHIWAALPRSFSFCFFSASNYLKQESNISVLKSKETIPCFFSIK